ncbi:MAG: enoyl-CoA hydratase/isomerase family protein [Bacteroidetes bacterium]|jgi:methylglutaconyl-CoA hydratase|nr:enoyl-CoA hydratase/isomerase family protein [Bacteroidota bacterium]
MTEMVEYQVEERVGYITLNRPDKRNALNAEMVLALTRAVERAGKDKQCKVVVVRAHGAAFSAGADLGHLQALQDNTFDENLADSRQLKLLFERIYNHPKVVIAQIEGHAIAGGCGLMTVCDFVFAVPEARFGYTEVKIGFVPAIVMLFLIRKIGESRAKDLLLTGRLFDAQEAQSLGLVKELIGPDAIAERVRGFAKSLALECSGESLRTTKSMIAEIQAMHHADALDFAARLNAQARATDDCKRGIAAFLNKEKITW